ncbi:MAG: hypothetical protein Kow0096_24800 [Thiohalomonadaceae bacterium]
MPSELRQLPWLLAKLFGGLLTAGGMLVAVLSATHAATMPPGVGLPAVGCGVAGMALFIGADRILRRAALREPAASRRHASLLPWALLLLFAALFLGAVTLLSGN